MYYCPFRKEIKTYAADGETPVPAKYAVMTKEEFCECLGYKCMVYISQSRVGDPKGFCALQKK